MLSIYQLIFSLIYWYVVLIISLFWKTYLGRKSMYIPYFFTYKPSVFSVFDTKV